MRTGAGAAPGARTGDAERWLLATLPSVLSTIFWSRMRFRPDTVRWPVRWRWRVSQPSPDLHR